MNRIELTAISCSLLIGCILGTQHGLVTGPAITPTTISAESKDEVGRSDNTSHFEDRVGHPSFMSPHASPIVSSNGMVFVVNTPSDTLDVFDAQQQKLVTRIPVGIDPVSVAVRPDGNEVWVSNHVSDSVSVVDTDSGSPTYLAVVATIQDLDWETRTTRFDEPVGIAFASNQKAYVALSSENRIAVVDVETRSVKDSLHINAQDPRDIVVRGNRLYVIPFESNNRTQLSGGTGEFDGDLVTFDAYEHSVTNNNVLSLGAVLDIVKHPDVPDHDLYVFDTETDKLVEVVDGVGTLLYGITVDSSGQVFVAQTDARNDVNGRSGTQGHGLKELENRAFLNQVTRISFSGDESKTPLPIELEPLPPLHPNPEDALATPFAIEVSGDDQTLFVSAAGSDKLISIDAETGEIVGRVDVDSVPRGIALQSDSHGDEEYAWVLNAVANTVSIVDVSDRENLSVVEEIALEDPTHPAIKRGRMAFNRADASTTGTFSCASCHPDGHTDQLLWVLKTPVVTGGNQIMPRSTMPIRGLRDTAPFHWDGIPGDPYGGNNSANVHGRDEPNSDVNNPESSTRHLIDGAMASTMSVVGSGLKNDEGKDGKLSAAERNDMAKFLLAVPYPPAQRRAYTNILSERAKQGFKLFHIDGDQQGDPTPNVCGDCHRMPFWVSTNTPGTGMDAPTWRGAYDRWLILPQGRLNMVAFDFYERVAKQGIPEQRVWQFSWAGRRRFDPVWNMVLEGSTGVSGSFGRQVTLDQSNVDNKPSLDLLDALEQSAHEGAVVLQAEGSLVDENVTRSVAYVFQNDRYAGMTDQSDSLTRNELMEQVKHGNLIVTFTARHGAADDFDHPQPAIWTLGPIEQQRGRQRFPILFPGNSRMTISGRHFDESAFIVVNGRRVKAKTHIEGETVQIELAELPASGMHFLQVQNPQGQFSNDFIFHVVADQESAVAMDARIDREHTNPLNAIADAIVARDMETVERWIAEGVQINARRDDGSTLLTTAALFGNVEAGQFLIEKGARTARSNRDGNTPLHIAAFMCQFEFVDMLLENGAQIQRKNRRGESSLDVVTGEWNESLKGFYRSLSDGLALGLDLEKVPHLREKMAERLVLELE